ncbi:MAG TPA: rhodanese-like domain-containing protein [Bradyrhizobium sp.]|nr:rhodanese-like domain-containing protein [Bradyrhizobium sp.]
MTPVSLNPADAQRLVADGATLVDIRDADEHAREHIPGALNLPLAGIADMPAPSGPIIFHCRSGMRTAANAARLADAVNGSPCYILAGGIDAWRTEGLPTSVDRRQPLEIMRQVQLVAGGLVLLGVVLGFLTTPIFFGLSALVGGGLMVAGATGWCGMATLLHRLPWNRRTLAA